MHCFQDSAARTPLSSPKAFHEVQLSCGGVDEPFVQRSFSGSKNVENFGKIRKDEGQVFEISMIVMTMWHALF